MQLIVNNVPVTVDSIATDMTLLRYLRGELQLTGTKEGCASGDCGACTVLVGTTGPDGLIYKAINSCICPLGSVNKQHVITVEGLVGDLASGHLHPVQEAMVTCHASQCGFCTPGFVMSLAALHTAAQAQHLMDANGARAAVIDAISGNLCRCTGYRPIIEAGLQALKQPVRTTNMVQEWFPSAPLVDHPEPAGCPLLEQAGHSYWQPSTEAELQCLLIFHPDARLIAGGTDLMLEATQDYKILPGLVDLSRISTLTALTLTDELLEIGAAASYAELEQVLKDISPECMRLLSRLGSRQIRNRGTVGGNICHASPIADMPPLLLVLDAELIIGNSAGVYRRELLSDFYLSYKQTTLAAGEYLVKILIKRRALAQSLKLYKISKRYEDDISAVMGAFLWDQQQLKIAFGGMAGVPRRASVTENFINQQPWLSQGKVDQSILEQAAEKLRSEFSPLSDVRASADYRMAMACNLLTKACCEFAAQASGESCAEGVFNHA